MADINPLKLVDLGNGIGQLKEMNPATDSLPGSYTSVTLADQASSNSLPPVGSQSPQSAIQILRNLGKWILDKFNTLGTASTAGLDTDPTFAANSDTRVPSQKAVKTFVETLVTGLLDFKGDIDASSNPNYPAAQKGDAYTISAAGKIGGSSGISVDVGDVIVAKADNGGGTQAAVGSSWFILEHNLQGALLSANNLSDLANATTAKVNLGLGNVDNTSDINKPISTATATELTNYVKRASVNLNTKAQIDAAINGVFRVDLAPSVYKDQGLTDYGTLTGWISVGSDTCGQWYHNYDTGTVFYRTGTTSNIGTKLWIKVPASQYRNTAGGTDNTDIQDTWWSIGYVNLATQSSVAKITILGTAGYGSADLCAGETVVHLRRNNNSDSSQAVTGYFFGQSLGSATVRGVAILLVNGLYRIFVRANPYSAICAMCDALYPFTPESVNVGSTLPAGSVLLSSKWNLTLNGQLALQADSNGIEVVGSNNGIVLASPNGTRWRVTIDNSGNIVRTSL